jgi:hypothetical protein
MVSFDGPRSHSAGGVATGLSRGLRLVCVAGCGWFVSRVATADFLRVGCALARVGTGGRRRADETAMTAAVTMAVIV